MEKAEAIKKIREWNLNSEQLNTLAEFIPELKESEDERIRIKAIEYINAFVPYDDKEEIVAYLEKQKEQKPANSEKPKEWSEEDEMQLMGALSAVESRFGRESFEFRWLESIRPQPQWKPSKKQMEALAEATYLLNGSEYSVGIDSLYYDLKSL